MSKMKHIIHSIILLLFLSFFSSCEKNELVKPKTAVNVNSVTVNVFESVEFSFVGKADRVTIFTGDEKHDYAKRNIGNTGFVVNKNRFTYSYSQPGIYKVVAVASNIASLGEEILTDTVSIDIQVIYDNTDIKSISCPKILYDEVFGIQNNNDWLIKLPKKLIFTGKVATMSSRQRLSIVTGSDSSTVKLNGQIFSSTSSYELKDPISVNVTAHNGAEREYMLYMLFNPEFSTFSINNVQGTLERDPFNYNLFKINIELPHSSDIKSLKPVFTLLEGQKVFVGDKEQVSGETTIDFTQPVVYTLINTVERKEYLSATSTVTVNVTLQTN